MENCAECGKPINPGEPAYASSDPWGKTQLHKTYHSKCGDLFGTKAKDAEIERLRVALKALHDWNVEYACVNNLFNSDGTPATFHELLQARRALEQSARPAKEG